LTRVTGYIILPASSCFTKSGQFPLFGSGESRDFTAQTKQLAESVRILEQMRTLTLVQSVFSEAAEAWLRSRQGHLAPRTYADYAQYIRTLSVFFAEMRIPEITSDQIRAYQQTRRQTAGPGIINHECMVLLQIRRRIGMPITDYEPLKMPKDWESPGRRLSEKEEEKLEAILRGAVPNPLWTAAACAALITMKSGIGPGEIRSLRLKDCSLDPPQITVPRAGAKNTRRERLVPLNDAAAWALEKLLDRAVDKCGCNEPEHYLIPFRKKDNSYDPQTAPSVQCFRTALRQLLGAADLKIGHYCLRHHAVSRGLSNPVVSVTDAQNYFGWVSPKMVRRYYHANLQGLKNVAEAIDKKHNQSAGLYDPRQRKTPRSA
jgi:integrase